VINFLQAYGDAVAEEAPLFVVSNYNATIFCRRDFFNVHNKGIWASPTITWDSPLLPPRAAWLYFMSVAQECCANGVKSQLRREQVLSTPLSGYSLPLSHAQATLQLNSAWSSGCQLKGTRQQPGRAAKRLQTKAGTWQQDRAQDWQSSSLVMTADTTGSAAPTSPAAANTAQSITSLLTAWISQLPHTPRKSAIGQLPWMQLEHVDLTMECIGSTSLARVLKVGHHRYCIPTLTGMFDMRLACLEWAQGVCQS
jgi:hypothetical protein